MTEPQSAPVAPEDQEFLALLVHRGFLRREDAVKLLRAAQRSGFAAALHGATGWDEQRVAYLKRTRGLAAPEIPGYQVLGKLGAGGTSEVFAARRESDKQKAALKILRPSLALDPPAVRRFLDEARLLERLDHPAIVRGRRVFKFLSTYVMEMELVPGRTLEELLHDGQVMEERRALAVIKAVAGALEYLRGQGILHRDLKPGNLMIDDKGAVKLIDLGFAGTGMKGRSDAQTTLGTPAYLSPEQAMGREDLDARSDIYSLGATLYHLVIGKLPFEGADDAEVMRKQILAGLKGSDLKGRKISPQVHYFIEKMMAKDREVRYATPKELIGDIEAMGY